MSFKSTRVVLLGRKTDEGESLSNLLGSIFPTEVPIEFIYKINLIFDSGETTEVLPEKLENPIYLDDPGFLLQELNINKPLDTLEVVIDLPSIKEKLSQATSTILDKYIEE
tara:strand:- start:2 stop:334 length:333 start_codon:yes stop_codon:yes gene_type:complete